MIPPFEDSDYVAHMELVLDVYKTLYDEDFPVVCMDESPKQLIKYKRVPVAAGLGREAREDNENE